MEGGIEGMRRGVEIRGGGGRRERETFESRLAGWLAGW